MLAIFGTLFASAFMTIALRALGVPYVVLALFKVGALGVFIWLGTKLGILTLDNLRLVRGLVLGRFRRSPA